MSLSFLTPQLFDALVWSAVIVGIVLAVLRIRSDFKRGPRFPEDQEETTQQAEKNQERSKKR